MFSGIIAYRGSVVGLEREDGGGVTLRVYCGGLAEERAEIKDSVAVNGVCLTVTAIDGAIATFDVVPETLKRSALGAFEYNERVNVEYSLRIGDRMGGHFVYGHVDETAKILNRRPEGRGERIRIERPQQLAPTIVDKAFVAIDGVSVTVAAVGDDWFDVALIPETLKRTTLGERALGALVHLEVDPLARYACRPVTL